MKTLIKNAQVLTMDEGDTEYERADILVNGSTIEAVGADLCADGTVDTAYIDRRIDASGKLAMPGLINGHFHSTSSFYRGCWDGDPLEVYLLHLEPEPSSPEYQTERFYYLRAMLGAMEMVRGGITSVRDDAVFSPVPSFEAIDGLMSGYRDIGMRAQVALEQVDLPEIDKHPFLREILPDHIQASLSEAPPMGRAALLEQYNHLIKQWHGAADDRLTAALTCSGPQRISTEYFQELADLSRMHDLSLNGHVLETKVQCVMGLEKFGKSLVRYVHDLGFLDERFVVIHAVWADDEDIEIMASSGCSIAHNPISNLRIGSGVMPFRKIQRAGIPVCIGTDEPCIDDSANLWSVTKVGALVQNITDPDYRNWPRAHEFLRAMTNGGAHAMRCGDRRGALAAGYDADIILLDLSTLAFTPLNDLRRQLVYAENGSSVSMTMVAGEVIYEDGKLLNIDEDAIKTEVNEIVHGFMKEARETTSYAVEYEPYFREMHLRAARQDIGFARWVTNQDQERLSS